MNTMKKLFLLPIFALALCVTSCGDDESFDDSKDTPVNKVTKKLKTIRYGGLEKYDDEDGYSVWEYVYDENGNVTSSIREDSDGDVKVLNYKWDENGITLVCDGEEREYYSLENDRIVSSKSLEYNTKEHYIYDDSGRMKTRTRYEDGELDTKDSYEWSGGKLMSINSTHYHKSGVTRSATIYEYSEKRAEGFVPEINYSFGFDIGTIITAMPWLVGAATQNLPSKVEGWEEPCDFTYEFYSDGYLKSVFWDFGRGEDEIVKISYTWE